MLAYSLYNLCFLFCMMLSSCNKNSAHFADQNPLKRTSYYFSNEGNDENDGSIDHPLKTLSVTKIIHFYPGDSILLKGGETFNDSIVLSINALAEKPMLLTSYGNGNSIINAGNQFAITYFSIILYQY